MASDLFLLSSSRVHGSGLLDFALPHLAAFLDTGSAPDQRQALFVPYAIRDWDGYLANVQAALAPINVSVAGLHHAQDPHAAVSAASVLLVGGGNTFRLLHNLQRLDLLSLVRQRVADGSLRYVGWSAGSNVACPTIRTTNDMPIVQPSTLDAFGLVPFQLNPHYIEPPTDSTHMGETRDQRLREFLEENDVPVLGLREGTWLLRHDHQLRLDGGAARLFRRGAPSEDVQTGADLSEWLSAPVRFDVPPSG